jgi:type IV pilus assembly protein PilX
MPASICRQLITQHRQQGGVLIISLILLFAFTLLVLGTSQQLLVEQKISTNQNDRQRAFQLAQLALQAAETKTQTLNAKIAGLTPSELFGRSGIFTSNCTNSSNPNGFTHGLCLNAQQSPGLQVAWERVTGEGSQRSDILSPCGHAIQYIIDHSASPGCLNGRINSGRQLWANPHYIIELLDLQYRDGQHPVGGLYRITARAWGRNRHTRVTLQSHYLVPNPIETNALTLIPLIEDVSP